jgi:hypothetical protein
MPELAAPTANQPPAPSEGQAQVGETGANVTQNIASIVDSNDGLGTLVVVGDYRRLDAIVQVNAYVDDDVIYQEGAAETVLRSSGTAADNIAQFIRNTQFSDTSGGHVFAGLDWNVDIFDGDFYDVRMLEQSSELSDRDEVSLSSRHTFLDAATGANQQYNLAIDADLIQSYDLIIVGDQYYATNWIFQTNVILDSDGLALSALPSEDEAPISQTGLTGQNWLFNEAVIETIGTDRFTPIDGDIEALIQALDGRSATLDRDFGDKIFGNGTGTLNVLYVTGSYYDINVVTQLNVIDDVDSVTLHLAADRAGGEDGFEQYAATGANTAANYAQIVDVGPLYDRYVGGEAYEDSILVQANLVVSDEDDVTTDTAALVPEVVAFVGPTESADTGQDASDLPVPDSSHDILGGVLS